MDTTVRPFAKAAGLTNVTIAGEGLEFTVYRATSPSHGDVALRVPKVDIYENVNDPYIEAKALLEQELKIYDQLRAGDVPVPVPRSFGLVQADNGRVASLAEYIDEDGSTASSAEIGRVLGALHSFSPKPIELVAQEGLDTLQALPQRIIRRWGEIQRLVPSLAALPAHGDLQEVAASLSWHPKCLLHMDMRGANLRVIGGRIVAVTDWSNALLGPAVIDLFRVLELGQPGPEFLEAYRQSCTLFELDEKQETLLRLDAAVMLALVFLSEAPDPDQAPAAIQRVQELVQKLQVALLV